jgi:ABC-type uncharacterized transport system involved in gliding motility auxiliary subunit
VEWLKRQEGSRLAVAALFVGAILFLAVNVLAGTALRGAQLDLTEDRLYTISEGTKRTLRAIDEPITLRLYYSRNLGEAAPQYGAYHNRIRELLLRYADLSGGKLQVQMLDPEPFSDAEDQAVADGLQGVPVNQAGTLGYLGLSGTNSTDGRAVIPFFNLQRETFVEYDLTKLIYGLANPKLPVIGLISGLPPTATVAGQRGGRSLQLLLEQMRSFFEVRDLEAGLTQVPADVKTLMVVAPQFLEEDMLRAIDRFVHDGGPAIVFLDPVVESNPNPDMVDPGTTEELQTLLGAWGLRLVPDRIAGDLDFARQVTTGDRSAPVSDYVAWLSLAAPAFDSGDPVFANVRRLNLASAGILEPVEGTALKVTPLFSTSPRSMAIETSRVRFVPDLPGLLRDFRAGGQALMLAATVSGEAKRAFAPLYGDTEGEGAASQPAADAPETTGEAKPIRVIVVADVDMLFDQFWASAADFFGERVIVPSAGNADFVINAVETLSNSEALSGLRGRGTAYRPFTLIEAYRRDAEAQFRAKEQELQQRLQGLQEQLAQVRRGQDAAGGEVLLSPETRSSIETYQREILGVRRELRDVQRALRQGIERLEAWTKFFNIAIVPILMAIAAIVVLIVRLVRRRGARRAALVTG